MSDENKIAVLSFYSFTNIEDPAILLPKILLVTKKKYVRGTVLVAFEGFNGSISGLEANVIFVVEEIRKITGAKDINIKINYAIFAKMALKVSLGRIALLVNSGFGW